MKHQETEQKERYAVIGRRNLIILLIGSLLIVTGYLLMSGKGSSLTAYNPDIFAPLRIRIAPLVCLAGYLLNIVGILWVVRKK